MGPNQTLFVSKLHCTDCLHCTIDIDCPTRKKKKYLLFKCWADIYIYTCMYGKPVLETRTKTSGSAYILLFLLSKINFNDSASSQTVAAANSDDVIEDGAVRVTLQTYDWLADSR